MILKSFNWRKFIPLPSLLNCWNIAASGGYMHVKILGQKKTLYHELDYYRKSLRCLEAVLDQVKHSNSMVINC